VSTFTVALAAETPWQVVLAAYRDAAIDSPQMVLRPYPRR